MSQNISIHLSKEHVNVLNLLQKTVPAGYNRSRVVGVALRELGAFYADASPELAEAVKLCDAIHGEPRLNPYEDLTGANNYETDQGEG